MKITKQKIWSLIQMLIAAYLIISGCAERDKAFDRFSYQKKVNEEREESQQRLPKLFSKNVLPVFKSTIETTSFTDTFLKFF
jgi:hypothetical protein